VIYTGGTFGMVASPSGYVPSQDLPQRASSALQQYTASDLPHAEWLESPAPPLDSGSIQPAFWFDLATMIASAAARYAGFVVIHGTDTLAFTGSALSFLLAGLGKPVVVTGSSRPFGEPGSDALANLVNAIHVAGSSRCTEVSVVFGHVLLRANRTTKRHSNTDNPFSSPAIEPLAKLGEEIDWNVPEGAVGQAVPDLPSARSPNAGGAALLAVYPGISGRVLRAVCATGIQALVLEGYPACIGPGSDSEFVDAIRDAVAAGIVIGAVSQSRSGRVALGKYAVSTPLAEAGLVSGADMTREAALTKLHVLLAEGLSPNTITERFSQDLCGELTPDG